MGKRRNNNKRDINGWFILDKPIGMTSTQALGKLKFLLKPKKAGHAGTLDPQASGLLPLAFGEATKTVPFVMDGRKVYRFTVRWGEQTTTDDVEGDIIETSDVRPDAQEIEKLLPEFTGEIMQVPPQFSAIKVNGERAYDIARDGEKVALEARPISVHRLTLTDRPDQDTAVFEAECGKGTYVRSLARDMAIMLGTRGHVVALRRLLVGPFGEEDMISLEKVEELANSAAEELDFDLASLIRPIETVLDDIPALAVNRVDAARLRNGQAVILRGRDAPVFEGTVSVTSAGGLVALAEFQQGALHPKRVFNLNSD
ncbi:MAG: tRNA pseudouridine(55) synthase TruB [Stappiaceae bacterium]